jgi:hypothetical protein
MDGTVRRDGNLVVTQTRVPDVEVDVLKAQAKSGANRRIGESSYRLLGGERVGTDEKSACYNE